MRIETISQRGNRKRKKQNAYKFRLIWSRLLYELYEHIHFRSRQPLSVKRNRFLLEGAEVEPEAEGEEEVVDVGSVYLKGGSLKRGKKKGWNSSIKREKKKLM